MPPAVSLPIETRPHDPTVSRKVSPDADVAVKAVRAIWVVTALMMIATWASYRLASLACDVWSASHAMLVVAACLAIAYFYRRWRPDPIISFGAEACAQLCIILTLGMLLSYPLAVIAFPYRDAELHAIDLSLGLHWRSYIRFFNMHPSLNAISDAAYHSIRVQFLIVIGVLAATSHFVRLQQFILAITFSLLVTLMIFAFSPAVGAYTHLQIPSGDYVNLSPSFIYLQHLDAMRSGGGGGFLISVDRMQGIITFPSFHTVCAILFAWALLPIRPLCWWIVALNGLMISATPTAGGHYFIDLVGGSIVAACAIAGASLFTHMLRIGAMSGILSPGRIDLGSPYSSSAMKAD
jgi:hypothetical protein